MVAGSNPARGAKSTHKINLLTRISSSASFSPPAPCAHCVPSPGTRAVIDRFAFPEELNISRTEAPLAEMLVTRERVSSVAAITAPPC